VILSLSVPDLKTSEVIQKLAASSQPPHIIAVHDAPTEEIRVSARAAGARMCLPTAAVAGSVRDLLGLA
jgi:DNA-binding response OmpR family regulator